MKIIILLFTSLYLWAVSLLCIDKPIVKHNIITVTEFVEQYLGDISEDINKEVPLETYTDTALVYAIEKVCQQRNLTVEQTFYIYKIFYL
jgi:hypothetical protein